MKKTLCFVLVFLLVCTMISCAVNREEPAATDETTLAPTSTQSDEKGPEQTEAPTQTEPSMPELGTDPGGFGPIF